MPVLFHINHQKYKAQKLRVAKPLRSFNKNKIGSLRKKRSDPIYSFYIIETMASRNSMLLTDFLFASDDSA